MTWQTVIDSVSQGDYVVALFQALMVTLMTIANIILYPFGLLIASVMPGLDSGLSALSQYFSYAQTYMSWIFSAFAIPAEAISIIAAYYLFSFTVSFGTWAIKLAFKWKKAIFV